jgi:RNA polymerase subunit RPABC4/transcription elongation factor Spt4
MVCYVSSFIPFYRILQNFKITTNWLDLIFSRLVLVTRGSYCPVCGEIVVNAAFCSLHVSSAFTHGISGYVFIRH